MEMQTLKREGRGNSEAEEKVSKFYNTLGWKTEHGITEDARRWEDLRDNAKEYVSRCRLRVLRHIPASGENFLDMASGPIQYEEYLEYSKNFKQRYCIDLSPQALEAAQDKIGDHGTFLVGSFFDIQLEDNFFDCAVSLHTIYHMDKDKQEEAVRKLIRVTKPGKPLIIVYSNPKALLHRFTLVFRLLKRLKRLLTAADPVLSPYFYAHPVEWWNRFRDVAEVRVLPWRSLASDYQKRLIPDNHLGKKLLSTLFELEERFPDFFVKHFQYPMIVLTKKP